ncbi:hypothetical protein ACP70R_032101 [Stipagrostis hirtigluma subsp. patula]
MKRHPTAHAPGAARASGVECASARRAAGRLPHLHLPAPRRLWAGRSLGERANSFPGGSAPTQCASGAHRQFRVARKRLRVLCAHGVYGGSQVLGGTLAIRRKFQQERQLNPQAWREMTSLALGQVMVGSLRWMMIPSHQTPPDVLLSNNGNNNSFIQPSS